MHHTLRISSRIMSCWPIIPQRLSLTKSWDISKADRSWRFEELFVFPRDWRDCDVVEPDGRPLDYWTLGLLIGGGLSKASWFSCSIVWCFEKVPRSHISLSLLVKWEILLFAWRQQVPVQRHLNGCRFALFYAATGCSRSKTTSITLYDYLTYVWAKLWDCIALLMRKVAYSTHQSDIIRIWSFGRW